MVPLIYETKSQDFYDKIILIDCDEDYQIKRASQRDEKSKEDIINIIKNQATREERQSIADEIILNNSTLDDLKNQVIKVHQRLLGININE
jgi:Dephospho-CoA kinase